MKTSQNILQQPLKQLGVTGNFVKICENMGFANLGEIIACDQVELQGKCDFSYLWLEELLAIFSANGLMDLWHPAMGKNSF